MSDVWPVLEGSSATWGGELQLLQAGESCFFTSQKLMAQNNGEEDNAQETFV